MARGRERDVETGKFPKVHGRQSGRNCASHPASSETHVASRVANIERSRYTRERQGERTTAGSHAAYTTFPSSASPPAFHFRSPPLSTIPLSTRVSPFREQGASFQRRCFAFTFLPSNNRPVSQRTYSLPVQAFCLPFLVHSSTERFIFVAPTFSIRSLSVVVPFSFLRTA